MARRPENKSRGLRWERFQRCARGADIAKRRCADVSNSGEGLQEAVRAQYEVEERIERAGGRESKIETSRKMAWIQPSRSRWKAGEESVGVCGVLRRHARGGGKKAVSARRPRWSGHPNHRLVDVQTGLGRPNLTSFWISGLKKQP